MKRSKVVLSFLVLLCLFVHPATAQQTQKSGKAIEKPKAMMSLESQWNRALAEVWKNRSEIQKQFAEIEKRYPDLAAAYAISFSYAFYAANRDIPGFKAKVGFDFEPPPPCIPWVDWELPGRKCPPLEAYLVELSNRLERWRVPSCTDLEEQKATIEASLAASTDAEELATLRAELETAEKSSILAGCPGNVCERLEERIIELNACITDPTRSTEETLACADEKINIIEERKPDWECP